MASGGMVVVSSHDGVAQASISRDIDTVLVSQNASVIVPVRKARAESGGDSTWESMEGIKDQWV